MFADSVKNALFNTSAGGEHTTDLNNLLIRICAEKHDIYGFFRMRDMYDDFCDSNSWYEPTQIGETQYDTFHVILWNEGKRTIPKWDIYFNNMIHFFILKVKTSEEFCDRLIASLDDTITDDLVEDIEVHINYINAANCLKDAIDEMLLLRNMIIRHFDECKSINRRVSFVSHNVFKIMWEECCMTIPYWYAMYPDGMVGFMDAELTENMQKHIFSKLYQRLTLELQTQSVEYKIPLYELSIEKSLIELKDDLWSIETNTYQIIDGIRVPITVAIVWRYGVQLILNWQKRFPTFASFVSLENNL